MSYSRRRLCAVSGLILLAVLMVRHEALAQNTVRRLNDTRVANPLKAKKYSIKKNTEVNGRTVVEVIQVAPPTNSHFVLQLYGFFADDGFHVEGVIQTSPCRHLHEQPDNGGNEASLEPGDVIATIGGYVVDNDDSYFLALAMAAKDDPNNVPLEVLDVENNQLETWYVKPRLHN